MNNINDNDKLDLFFIGYINKLRYFNKKIDIEIRFYYCNKNKKNKK